MDIQLKPLFIRLSTECYDMLKFQAKKERYSMAGLSELILREGLVKRLPGSLDYKTPDKTLENVEISMAVDRMVKSNDQKDV